MNINISEFTSNLKARGLAPQNIQFANWENWTMVSAFSKLDEHFISENVSMGIDRDPQTALLKALTEFCERKIMNETTDPIARLTERSDGFAALPKSYKNSEFKVEENAMNEAIERFLWAKWWDNTSVKYHISNDFTFSEKEKVFTEFELEDLFTIHVLPSNHNSSLLILLAKIKDAGYVSGGAAGTIFNKDQVFSRAFGELLRHLIVVKKMRGSESKNPTFYEKRLLGFGSGIWNKVVEARLGKTGDVSITLPNLSINKTIEHPDSDFMILHRCLFVDQPLFMGGQIERLCI